MRILLLSGHPGHELRVHQWLRQYRPTVMILTTGAVPSGVSTLSYSERLLAGVGVQLGPIFGRYDDREVYRLLLERNVAPWQRLVHEIADWVCEQQIEMVVGDAREGYNPTHDLCRTVQNAVVALANKARSQPVQNWQYELVTNANRQVRSEDQVTNLDDEALAEKLAAAEPFRSLRPEFANEFALGAEHHRQEILQPADIRPFANFAAPPFYEQHGQKRVASGVYQQCLTYREHLLPVEEALHDLVCKAA